MLVLSSCGSTVTSSTATNKDTTINDIGEENSALSAETTEDVIKAEETLAYESDNVKNNAEEAETVDERNVETEEDPYPFYPWGEQLPEGIEATVQKFDDFTLLVRYKNNTGKDIALSTECVFFDDNSDGIGSYSTIQE